MKGAEIGIHFQMMCPLGCKDARSETARGFYPITKYVLADLFHAFLAANTTYRRNYDDLTLFMHMGHVPCDQWPRSTGVAPVSPNIIRRRCGP